MVGSLIKQSGDWISFPYLDYAQSQLVRGALGLLCLVGLGAGFGYLLRTQPQSSWGVLGFVLIIGLGPALLILLWHTAQVYRQSKIRVWIDLHNCAIIVGSREYGVQYDSMQFNAVSSRFDIALTRYGERRVAYMSLTLQGRNGDLELARFSNPAFAIDGWRDHAHAKALRELLAERLGLVNLGILGNNLPEQIAADKESIESAFTKQIAPRGFGIGVRRAMKALLLLLSTPLFLALIIGAATQRLQYRDTWMLLGAFFILALCWLGVDSIERKQDRKAQLVRMSLLAGVVTFAVALSATFGGRWGSSLELFATSFALLAYWYHERRKLSTREGSSA